MTSERDTDAESVYKRFTEQRPSDPAKGAITWSWLGKALVGAALSVLIYQAQVITASINQLRTDIAVIKSSADDARRTADALARRLEVLESKVLGGQMSR